MVKPNQKPYCTLQNLGFGSWRVRFIYPSGYGRTVFYWTERCARRAIDRFLRIENAPIERIELDG